MASPTLHQAESRVKINTTNSKTRVRPIDLVYLAKQTLGDCALEAEVLGMFAQMSVTYLRRLQDTAALADFPINIHSLKGAALGMGANAIAQSALSAEQEFNKNRIVCPETMQDLELAIEEANKFIADLLAD